jgi:hypothetical protein
MPHYGRAPEHQVDTDDESQRPGRRPASPPLDGPEIKFRFSCYLERTGGSSIFDAPLDGG